MAIQRKAIALISGGLDSMLAVKTIQNQGIKVEGVNFYTGFCVEGHTHAIRKKDKDKEKRNNSLWVAEQLGIKMNIVDISKEYKDIVLNPQYGYGANLNPCLDCKIFMVEQANAMLNKARELADEGGFDFIITGEVIGQRPKSQRKETMPLIARESGADDRLLRPLSAKLLPPTLPEREGWIDREQLHDFSGRNRKPQIALAKQYGLDDFAQPAGGCCFLTDESYSRKLADLWTAQGRKDYELDDIMLLKVGRHIRPAPNYKLIVSREEGENNFLHGYRKQFHAIHCISHGGPLTLVDGDPTDEDLLTAARIATRFSQGKHADQVLVEICSKNGVARQLEVKPMPSEAISQAWYV
ncbi:tRNA (5-methylaminomethyl-2-thiouridylate)-methyltransferase [Ketobacter sp. MCCC 1A13808]|uniref:tRNA (5-methylaminomethyl-2-thiouridylate)-methyltransferase n=1 Tax=Ketobacter sp. MCCC 1A13808 TaxID=2602738 RepID=UPI000F257D03|nr:tRNA (5-methylaminomethyl-2-thiouridylate)-methyltransferase [Ketobacter sp. MCCC 1A13808]MVF13838.1 tRNA (5-methylaminomethyl-2-thiouridylate)-methyltransferase [Ketobacter sp. MCCC 1A13808]RLP54889.1 MAG: tRNA (5-methylaminomethyl-2-thiouridylate)-methyltransferase [Ketobacter sp.]